MKNKTLKKLGFIVLGLIIIALIFIVAFFTTSSCIFYNFL